MDQVWPLVEQAYDTLVVWYVHPTHPAHYLISCLSFLAIMLTLCHLVERTNPDRDIPIRKQQIKREIKEAIPAVFTSTCVSLVMINYVYPARWGHDAPVFPDSVGGLLWECIYWFACFEVNSYYLHRMLHWRRPVDLYKLVHREHHLFFFPTAFASQSIAPVESAMFATCAFVGTLTWMPVCVVTQYACGLFMLTWSIFAHDSRYILDHSAHYEHHGHPDTNFGFIGVMDVLHRTVWWGAAYDDPSQLPGYHARWRQWHEAVFGPLMLKDNSSSSSSKDSKDGQQAMEADFSEETRQELKQRRLALMNKQRS